jgi:hypothetical protein
MPKGEHDPSWVCREAELLMLAKGQNSGVSDHHPDLGNARERTVTNRRVPPIFTLPLD